MSIHFENALIERTVSAADSDHVTINELWDLDHTDCPFVSYRPVYGLYGRFAVMSRREYQERFGVSVPGSDA